MEEQRENVRSLLLTLLLLVAPLPLGDLVDEDVFVGTEVELHLPNGQVWGQSEWDNLVEFGYIPLRLMTPSELVAWKVNVDAQHPSASENEAQRAVWKSIPVEGQTVRVVLEPGLPYDVVAQIQTQIRNYGNNLMGSFEMGYLPTIEIIWTNHLSLEWYANVEGILWLEPQLSTQGRNLNSAKLLSASPADSYPSAWTFGLNGSGVVIGVADTGIDSDHSCFRNISDASIGSEHRKLLHVNTTIDDWDTSGHADYRHGTHTAGILGCHPFTTATEDNMPSALMALGYDSQLVIQDIVSEQGWLPPDVDLLLAESAMYGGFLHSNSWGDDTTDYTLRSGDFDAFTREFPWTLPLIAPGNNGGPVLEPANARNVIAIGASTKDSVPERWMSSVHGPTDAETRGIFALAPGVSIVSARSDGSPETYNAGQHTLSGTSMSTPMAATYASVVQQMVQEGWLTGHNETLTEHKLDERVPWFEADIPRHSVLLGEGFTPSAPLMKALLSLSTTSLDEAYRNGGEGGSDAPNNYDGWGLLNLSELVDFDRLSSSSTDGERAVSDVWIHDSYRLIDAAPSEHFDGRVGETEPIEYLMENAWDGGGAIGPFLATGDMFQQRFILNGDSLDLRLSIQAKPEPHLVDDVQLMVRLPDGRFAVGESYRNDGRSMLYYDFADHLNTTAFPSSNETTVGIHLDEQTLDGVEYVDVIVTGRYVTPGNHAGTLGVEGNRVGFGLAIRGVELDPLNHSDADGDGIPYEFDFCPFTNAFGWDVNEDGCIDDLDDDGIEDNLDDCLMTPQNVPITESGCAQQNDVPRIFLDEVLLQEHNNETITVLFSILDQDDVNVTVVLERLGLQIGSVSVCSVLVSDNTWNQCSVNVSQDFFPLSANGNWTVQILAEDLNSSSWTIPASATYTSEQFTIELLPQPDLEERRKVVSWMSTALWSSIGLAILLSVIAQFWFKKEKKMEN
jgi:hypothetical protein